MGTGGFALFSYLVMPVMSGLVGWGTNVLAIKMMFYPLEFWGKPPYFGWQGIIPSKIARMASITVDTMTSKLITIEEVFSRLDPQRVAAEIDDSLEAMIDPIIDETMKTYSPRLWKTLPGPAREMLRKEIRKDRPLVVARIMEEVKSNINRLLDLKGMIIEALLQDKSLMNRIFLDCGREEFKFIARSGLYLGFFFGLIQMGVWWYVKTWWLLPVAGLLVGYITNWLALKMIFHPTTPVDAGPFSFHGLFLMRQREVAEEYGKLVTEQILTPGNILEAILRGPATDEFFRIVQKHTKEAIDQYAGHSKPLVLAVMGSERYAQMKDRVYSQIRGELPETLKALEEYAGEAMDIRNTLTTKLAELSSEDYVGILRPAFQQDEWKLIVAGGVLGCLVGFFQLFFMFGDVLVP